MRAVSALVFLACSVPGLLAARDRIVSPIDSARRIIVKGHVHPQALRQYDRGPVDSSMQIRYASMLVKPADGLEQFLTDQQSPSSPDYRRWLTPEQFGERFGLSASDRSKVFAWMRAEGLTVHDAARGGLWISFSGSARQIGRAFRTEFHRYQVSGESHFANATEPSVPEALQGVVAGFNGFDDFAPKSMMIPADVAPDYNSGSTHLLAPEDLATIYNIAPLYAQGIDGTGMRIAVVGRTTIDLNDVRAFRRRFNLPEKDPELMLYGPDPGRVNGSEVTEANLDIQWAGAVAPNATVVFVYAQSVNTAVQYAVDQNTAPVMSMSFGQCEQFGGLAMRGIAQQANAQGITFLVASGDGAAATCDWQFGVTPQASKGATVSYPASLPEVTAVGGTELNDSAGSFWANSNSANGGSALGYIPEKTWNQTPARNALAGAGGGPSAVFPKPFWQAGPGVPDDRARDLPDIALSASTHDAYYVISNGATIGVGGTSASSPAFAGLLALLNQYLVSKGVISQPGLGNINPALYRMAQRAPDAFHDIVDGDIMVPCAQGTPGCADGLVGFAAGPRYDLATGLGTVDAFRLVTQWDLGTPSQTTITADPTSVGLSDTVKITANVSGAANGAVPTGTVSFLANGAVLASAALTGAGDHATAGASVNAAQIAAGNNAITAFYSGDVNYSHSSATAPIQFNFPASAAVVVASVNPNPVVQGAVGFPYTLRLVEKAGIGARVSSFSIDGVSQPVNSLFGTSRLEPNGSLSTSLASTGIAAPLTRVFRFTGTDDNENPWTQELTVSYVPAAGPLLTPGISLSATPASVSRNPQADAPCQWSQQIAVQEKGGFLTTLSSLRFGAATDLTSKIQDMFGTTRLAPFSTLRGTVCFDAATASGTRNYTISGISEIGLTVSATLSATLGGPPPVTTAATVSLTPASVTIPLAAGTTTASKAVDLLFQGAATQWTATVLPGSAGGDWLKVSPSSGSGPTQLQFQASGERLSKGVYFAVVAIQAAGASPQVMNLPVALVVGASKTTSIAGVGHAATGKTAFAPGMQMSVYGTNLAPSTAQAARLPLPLTLAGVSATVNGVTAPFYFVSTGQINLQVPYETSAGTAVLGINNNGEVASFLFEVSPAAPGIFADTGGSLAPSPTARSGDPLVAYITGDGDLTPTIATGATPSSTTPLSRLPKPRKTVSVTIGGVDAEIKFIGEPSGFAGVTQINLVVPAGIATGVQPLIVTVGSVASPPVDVYIQPN